MSILPLCASARLRLHSSNVNSNLPFVARIGEAGHGVVAERGQPFAAIGLD